MEAASVRLSASAAVVAHGHAVVEAANTHISPANEHHHCELCSSWITAL